MPKNLNLFNIIGFVIGGVLGYLNIGQFLSTIETRTVVLLYLNLLFIALGALAGFLIGQGFAFLVPQKRVVTEYKVETLKYRPEVRELRDRLSDEQIEISFENLPRFEIGYFPAESNKDKPTEVRYARVLEEKTDDIVLQVISWEYWVPLQKYLQHRKENRYVFIVPQGTVFTS